MISAISKIRNTNYQNSPTYQNSPNHPYLLKKSYHLLILIRTLQISEVKELNQSLSNHAVDDKLGKLNGDQMVLAECIGKHDSKFSTFKTKAENELTL